jgi:Protein of unknown function (DUF3551)
MGQRMKFPLFAFSVIALAAVFPSAVAAQSYPWYAMTDLGDVVANCYFDSFERCKASLGGTHDFCVKNNTYKPPPPESVSAEDAAAPAQVPLPPAKNTMSFNFTAVRTIKLRLNVVGPFHFLTLSGFLFVRG